MKKILTIILVCLCNHVFPQVVLQSSDSKEMKKFLASKTLFVLTGNKDFDDHLKSAVTKYWKITPHDFIPDNDFDSKVSDDSFSLMAMIEFVTKVSDVNQDFTPTGSKVRTQYDRSVYGLIAGGRKKINNYTEKDQIGYINFDNLVYERDKMSSAYRLDFIIKGLNDGIELVIKNNISGGSDKVAQSVFDKYGDQASVLKQKTLLIDKYYTTDRGPHMGVMVDVKELQKHGIKYEIKTREEILEILKNGDSKYCFYFGIMSIGFGFTSYIYDVETKSTIFANLDMKDFFFSKKAMEKLFSAMDGKK